MKVPEITKDVFPTMTKFLINASYYRDRTTPELINRPCDFEWTLVLTFSVTYKLNRIERGRGFVHSS